MTKFITKIPLLWWLFIVTFLVAICSCSTTHKIKSTEQRSTDSTGTKQTATVQVNKIDSSNYKATDSSYKEAITINFDTTAQPVNDYEAAELKPIKGPYVYHIAGNTIKTPARITSATIERHGHKQQIEAVQVNKTDSLATSAKEESKVITQEKKTIKDTTTRRTPFLLFTGLMLLLFVAVYYTLKKYNII